MRRATRRLACWRPRSGTSERAATTCCGAVHPRGGGSVKTVYDPCPAGYRVPDARHFAELKFTSKAECDANYGMLFALNGEDTKSYFPTTGYLEADKHITKYLEYRGYMWLNAGDRLYLNNAGVNTKAEPHAKGMAVRCVKIEQ